MSDHPDRPDRPEPVFEPAPDQPERRRAARPTATPPRNRTGLGVALSLLALPLAIALLVVMTAISGVYGGFAAALIPYLVLWLYLWGAGRVSIGPVIAVSIVAILLGALAAGVTRAFIGFAAVGGDGGVTSPVFQGSLLKQLTSPTDTLTVVLLSIGFGIVGLIVVLLSPKTPQWRGGASDGQSFGKLEE